MQSPRQSQKLLTHQCHKPSGFTVKKFIVDRILELESSVTVCVISAPCENHAAFVILGKLFISVNPDVLWKFPAIRGKRPNFVFLQIFDMYSSTETVVQCGGTISDHFPLSTWVRQGCVLETTHSRQCMGQNVGNRGMRMTTQ